MIAGGFWWLLFHEGKRAREKAQRSAGEEPEMRMPVALVTFSIAHARLSVIAFAGRSWVSA